MEAPYAATRPARMVLLVQVLDLNDAEATALRERLLSCNGMLYAEIDAASGFTEIEYAPPCTADTVIAVLRQSGKPVLTEFACC